MVINGVALLAVCSLAGLLLGEMLGRLLRVQANVGGVGIAMILLIFAAEWLIRRGLLSAPSQRGIEFWSAIYVPIVIGMAAQQNVVGAVSGGPAAILAGTLAVAIGFALVPVITGTVDTDSTPVRPPDDTGPLSDEEAAVLP